MDFIRKKVFIPSAKITSLAFWWMAAAEFTNKANRSGDKRAPCGTPEKSMK